MKTSQTGVNLIKSFEGLRLRAYKALSSEKYYTIGYGHYGADVTSDQIITEKQAEEMLKTDLVIYENKVNKYENIYHFNQNQFDALVSFCYNIGSIDQLTNYGKRTLNEISEKMLLYNKAGGKVMQGLINRRQKEQELFNLQVIIELKYNSFICPHCGKELIIRLEVN